MIGDLRIVEDPNLVVPDGEDWSRVRSPGLARRRRAKHRQNIVTRYKPDTKTYLLEAEGILVMHPEIAAEFRRSALIRELEEDLTRKRERDVLDVLTRPPRDFYR